MQGLITWAHEKVVLRTFGDGDILFTFRMRHSRGKMYIDHSCLCVCLSVLYCIPTTAQTRM